METTVDECVKICSPFRAQCAIRMTMLIKQLKKGQDKE